MTITPVADSDTDVTRSADRDLVHLPGADKALGVVDSDGSPTVRAVPTGDEVLLSRVRHRRPPTCVYVAGSACLVLDPSVGGS